MSMAPQSPGSPDNGAPETFSANAGRLGNSLIREGKKDAKYLALSGKILSLKWMRLRALYGLGARCYDLGLFRELHEARYAAIDRLKTRIADRGGFSENESKSFSQLARHTTRRLALAVRARFLLLKLWVALTRLGVQTSTQTAPEIQEEQRALRAILDQIEYVQMRRRQIASADTGLGKDAKSALKSVGANAKGALEQRVAGTKEALGHGWKSARPAGDQLLRKGTGAGWRELVTKSPFRRIKAWHLGAIGACILACFVVVAVYYQFFHFDETDPKAVADRADRLAAHPGDSAKPLNVAGVSDEELMRSRKNARALDICISALENSPDDPRRLFELGRILLLAGASEEARPFLEEAVALGHAGAKAYLGRLEPDPEKALALFREAAGEGFAPAAKMAGQMEAYINGIFAEAGRKADELAAHPDDLTKPKDIKGVPDYVLRSDEASFKAIAACAEAVAAFPEDPRQRFQFGRVLLIAEAEEARGHLEFAAEKGHAAALAYLAQLQDDAFAAMEYLRRAERAGFIPAKRSLMDLEAQAGPDFEGHGYFFGDILRALYDKNLEYLYEDAWCNLHYADFINFSFKASAANLYDPGLYAVLSPKLKYLKERSEGNVTPSEFLLGIIHEQLPERQPLPELEKNAGANIQKDIDRLIATYGKDGAIAQRVAEGIQIFIRR